MTKEVSQELLTTAEQARFVADFTMDLGDLVGNEVREPPVLQVRPDLFRGIEFGGVGRQPDDVPAAVGLEPSPDGPVTMRLAAIPEQDHRLSEVPIELLEEVEDLGTADVHLGMEGESESQSLSTGRHDYGAEAGDLLVRARTNREGRGDATAAPRPPHQRVHQKAGFTRADQAGAQAREFFLPGASPRGATAGPAARRAPWREAVVAAA